MRYNKLKVEMTLLELWTDSKKPHGRQRTESNNYLWVLYFCLKTQFVCPHILFFHSINVGRCSCQRNACLRLVVLEAINRSCLSAFDRTLNS